METEEFLSYMPSVVRQQFGAKTTLEWRKEQKAAAMRYFWKSSTIDKAIGIPMGKPVVLQLLGVFGAHSKRDYTIHSHFYNTLVKRGVLGVGVFLLIILYGALRILPNLLRNVELSYISYPVMMGLLIGQIAFSFGYWLMIEQGLILGLYIATYRSNSTS